MRLSTALGRRALPVLAGVVCGLLGLSAALALTGLVRHAPLVFSAFFDGGGPSGVTVIAAGLFALALGVGLPPRLALRAGARAWHRFVLRGRPSELVPLALHDAEVDRPLQWTVMSLISLAAGVAMALTPLLVRGAGVVMGGLDAHFVWSMGPLVVLHMLLMLLVMLFPFGLLGVAVVCGHHLCCRHGRWDVRGTAWILIGAAAGVLLAGAGSAGDRGGAMVTALPIVAASLPLLLIALMTSCGTSWAESDAAAATEAGEGLPSWSEPWPALLRASVAAVGGGGACALTIRAMASADSVQVGRLMAVMLAALGAGVWWGCRLKRTSARSAGGFGMACALAGVVVSVAAAMAHPETGGAMGRWMAAGASALAIGLACAYGTQTLLLRVAGRSVEGARVLVRLLICAGFTVWIAAPLIQGWVGMLTTQVMLSLSLLALGGLVVLHEPSDAPHMRRRRMGVILGWAAVMAVASTLPGNPWRDAGGAAVRAADEPSGRSAMVSRPPSALHAEGVD